MSNNLDLTNKKVAILGLGIEGIATALFLIGKVKELTVLDKLSKSDLLANASSEDRSKIETILEHCNLISGEQYLEGLSDFEVIFRSPGISANHPKLAEAGKSGAEICSQIKLFFDLCPCKIIGVTGTKGKGTTASLIYEILKKQSASQQANKSVSEQQIYLAGNIGSPAINLISKLNSYDIVILELSSFQLMDLEKSPHIAVVVNLSVDHMDYHHDVAEYRRAKFNIVKYQTESDITILNSESTFNDECLSQIRGSKKYYSILDENQNAYVSNDAAYLRKNDTLINICSLDEIKLFGRHNLCNIAAASIVADNLGVDIDTIRGVVKDFAGLPHRIELVAEINGVKFINDSFATNPEPTIAAINSFSEDKILVIGGSSKNSDFSRLALVVSETNVKSVVLIGAESDKIEKALEERGYSGGIKKGFSDLDEVVRSCIAESKEGDVVLFSPACASFDMFKNYKDRGERFKTAVLNLNPKSKFLNNK